MMTDPIADMLTRIRNAVTARHKTVTVPASNLKRRIAEILKEEGYIEDLDSIESGVQGSLKLVLRYNEETDECPIHGLQRVSKPGCRVYTKKQDIPWVLSGLGIAILSTPEGVMTGKKARRLGVGGEVLCYIW